MLFNFCKFVGECFFLFCFLEGDFFGFFNIFCFDDKGFFVMFFVVECEFLFYIIIVFIVRLLKVYKFNLLIVVEKIKRRLRR